MIVLLSPPGPSPESFSKAPVFCLVGIPRSCALTQRPQEYQEMLSWMGTASPRIGPTVPCQPDEPLTKSLYRDRDANLAPRELSSVGRRVARMTKSPGVDRSGLPNCFQADLCST